MAIAHEPSTLPDPLSSVSLLYLSSGSKRCTHPPSFRTLLQSYKDDHHHILHDHLGLRESASTHASLDTFLNVAKILTGWTYEISMIYVERDSTITYKALAHPPFHRPMSPGLVSSSAAVLYPLVRRELWNILESVRKVPKSIFSPFVFFGAIHDIVSISRPTRWL